jgi:hypothetical protein
VPEKLIGFPSLHQAKYDSRFRQPNQKSNFSKWFSLIVLLLIVAEGSLFAAKTDIVIQQNGDRNTGEIKELKFGKLKYGTDDAGTIVFEWDKIAYLKTVNHYQVETEEGDKYLGALDTDSLARKLLVLTATDTIALDMPLVVWIIRVKDKFWSRLGASLRLTAIKLVVSSLKTGFSDPLLIIISSSIGNFPTVYFPPFSDTARICGKQLG